MKPYQSRTPGSKDDWETPPELFNKANDVFRFNLDAAANESNSLCGKFLEDALTTSWVASHKGARIWCNPPFSKKVAFLGAALQYRQQAEHIVFLLPNNSRETEWWNELVVPYADLVINLIGRVNFLYKGVPSKQCNFPSCLVVYQPRLKAVYGNPTEISWDWRK